MSDVHFIHRCLELAVRGRGKVGNGAMVGSVLVREGNIIAEAYHAGFGKPHAERALLEAFPGEVHTDDTLYVNLEPCCHHGKTLPCTDILLKRGIKKLVYGMADPDSRVEGKGIALLQQKGIAVRGSLARAECERLNAGFISTRRVGRPFITVKMAMNRAGSISKNDGSPLKITTEDQDEWSHTYLRGRRDAILVGVGTILADDPLLNTRFAQKENTEVEQFSPLIVVLDPNGRITVTAKILQNSPRKPIIVIKEGIPLSPVLRDKAQVIACPIRENGLFDFSTLFHLLIEPQNSFHGLTSILVEGGKRTWDAFLRARVVDELILLRGV
ncbi:MAG: bifunctional diaminohydroxyphosphoribosylaminopyrimidine deaminase/5-amino-6-(5-phosphoribosylamino)uracil reductase RibD [Candidatus Peregrinibacteria bacterium]|nr:bifunctional diaminohydroxyphosphoribosylaminopyrimidine deaminase/5-amino-6-(5-phosphoribosylamino)uracil reductase RibD [Candidatus Peregrinibacteria bacterium]